MKLRYLCIFVFILVLMLPEFVLSQSNSGWNTQTTTATFGFGSQKFNSQLASVFKVQVPFPVYVSGKITIVVAPWWLLVLVFMIFYPIIDIITGFVPPFSKAAEMGSKGVERSKTVFTIGFSVLAMFVTPLVPYVVQLVTVGTTMGVWWFWMLLFMMFIWGVNWLFGESPFGDPFRKGAAGLGHIGSSGMSKFKKHFREEMNDTTNEAKLLTDLDSIMNQNIQKNQKERNLIENLRQLLHLLVQARNVNSSAARPILEKMRARLLELKTFIESEDNLNRRISILANSLKNINDKASNITKSFEAVNTKIMQFYSSLISAQGVNRQSIINQFNSKNTTLGKSFPEFLAEIRKDIRNDNITDAKQAEIASKIGKLNNFLSYNSTRQELGIINSMISKIDEILLGKVSSSEANKFIKFAWSSIQTLQHIEENNSNLLKEVLQVSKSYFGFLKNESSKTNSLAFKISLLEKEINSVINKGSFS